MIDEINPDLTLTGLRMIYEANKEKFAALEPIGPLVVSAEEELDAQM